jgi:hypothetical protein
MEQTTNNTATDYDKVIELAMQLDNLLGRILNDITLGDFERSNGENYFDNIDDARKHARKMREGLHN